MSRSSRFRGSAEVAFPDNGDGFSSNCLIFRNFVDALLRHLTVSFDTRTVAL